MLTYAFLLADRECHAFKKMMEKINLSEEETLSISNVIEKEDYVPLNE